MTITPALFWIIIGSAIVTWLPRIIPFIFVRSVELPPLFLKWLSYIPLCILSALVFESFWSMEAGELIWHRHIIFAALPTGVVAILSRSMTFTVFVGIICTALIRQWT